MGSCAEPVPVAKNGCPLEGIFVAKFDTIVGNVMEWKSARPGVDVTGVEFTTLPSGGHTVTDDVIYFKRGQWFGVAVFQCDTTQATPQERGARMKSVGVLSKSYRGLRGHVEALRAFVGLCLEHHDQDLEHSVAPALQAYLKQYTVPSLVATPTSLPVRPPYSMEDVPAGTLTDFVLSFGPRVFSIWKHALTEKRILFYATPPLERACHFVHCVALLAQQKQKHFRTVINPLFLVHLNDVHGLLDTGAPYIACTSEQILASKRHLYDLFLGQPSQPPTSASDRRLFAQMQRKCLLSSSRSTTSTSISTPSSTPTTDQRILQYFEEKTTRLLVQLTNLQAAFGTTRVGVLKPSHFEALELDPKADAWFVRDLLAISKLEPASCRPTSVTAVSQSPARKHSRRLAPSMMGCTLRSCMDAVEEPQPRLLREEE